MESEALLWSQPDWTGHLDKYDDNADTWTRKFFLLRESFLFYFQNELDRRHPLGVIPLERCQVIEVPGDASRKHKFLLTVAPHYAALGKHDKYSFATTSADSLKRIVRTLQDAAYSSEVLVGYLHKTWARAAELRSLLARSPNDKKAVASAQGLEAQAIKTELVKTYLEMEDMVKKVKTICAEADKKEKDLWRAEIRRDFLASKGHRSAKDSIRSKLQYETKITRDLCLLLQKKANYLQGQGLEDLTEAARKSLYRMLMLALEYLNERHAKIRAEAPRYSFHVDPQMYYRGEPPKVTALVRRKTILQSAPIPRHSIPLAQRTLSPSPSTRHSSRSPPPPPLSKPSSPPQNIPPVSPAPTPASLFPPLQFKVPIPSPVSAQAKSPSVSPQRLASFATRSISVPSAPGGAQAQAGVGHQRPQVPASAQAPAFQRPQAPAQALPVQHSQASAAQRPEVQIVRPPQRPEVQIVRPPQVSLAQRPEAPPQAPPSQRPEAPSQSPPPQRPKVQIVQPPEVPPPQRPEVQIVRPPHVTPPERSPSQRPEAPRQASLSQRPEAPRQASPSQRPEASPQAPPSQRPEAPPQGPPPQRPEPRQAQAPPSQRPEPPQAPPEVAPPQAPKPQRPEASPSQRPDASSPPPQAAPAQDAPHPQASTGPQRPEVLVPPLQPQLHRPSPSTEQYSQPQKSEASLLPDPPPVPQRPAFVPTPAPLRAQPMRPIFLSQLQRRPGQLLENVGRPPPSLSPGTHARATEASSIRPPAPRIFTLQRPPAPGILASRPPPPTPSGNFSLNQSSGHPTTVAAVVSQAPSASGPASISSPPPPSLEGFSAPPPLQRSTPPPPPLLPQRPSSSGNLEPPLPPGPTSAPPPPRNSSQGPPFTPPPPGNLPQHPSPSGSIRPPPPPPPGNFGQRPGPPGSNVRPPPGNLSQRSGPPGSVRPPPAPPPPPPGNVSQRPPGSVRPPPPPPPPPGNFSQRTGGNLRPPPQQNMRPPPPQRPPTFSTQRPSSTQAGEPPSAPQPSHAPPPPPPHPFPNFRPRPRPAAPGQMAAPASSDRPTAFPASRALAPPSYRPPPPFPGELLPRRPLSQQPLRPPEAGDLTPVRPLRRSSSLPSLLDVSLPSAAAAGARPLRQRPPPPPPPPPPRPVPVWRPRPTPSPSQLQIVSHGQPQPSLRPGLLADQRSLELLDVVSFAALNLLKHLFSQAEAYIQNNQHMQPRSAIQSSPAKEEDRPETARIVDEGVRSCDGETQTREPESGRSDGATQTYQAREKQTTPEGSSASEQQQARRRMPPVRDPGYLRDPAGLRPLPVFRPRRRRPPQVYDVWREARYEDPYSWRRDRVIAAPRRRIRAPVERQRVLFYPDDEDWFWRRDRPRAPRWVAPRDEQDLADASFEVERPRNRSPSPAPSSRSVVSSRRTSASSTTDSGSGSDVNGGTASVSMPGLSIDVLCTYEFDFAVGSP